jgi:hypothetical protein
MSKLFKGVLVAVATMAGIYATASAIATNMVSGFSTLESDRHAGIIEFAAARQRAVSAHEMAIAKCERFDGALKNNCAAVARSAQGHADDQARANYKENIKSAANDGVSNIQSVRTAGYNAGAVPDAALYRAHREFSDWRPNCFASGDDDFKVEPRKILSRVASN